MASWEQLKKMLLDKDSKDPYLTGIPDPESPYGQLLQKKQDVQEKIDKDLYEDSVRDSEMMDKMVPGSIHDPLAHYNSMKNIADGLAPTAGITKAGKLFGPSGKLLNNNATFGHMPHTGEGMAEYAKDIIKNQRANLVSDQEIALNKALWAEQATTPKLNEPAMQTIARKLGISTGDEIPNAIDSAKKNIASYPKTPDLAVTLPLDVFKKQELAQKLKQSDPENFKKVVDLMKKRSPEVINATEIERQANAIGPAAEKVPLPTAAEKAAARERGLAQFEQYDKEVAANPNKPTLDRVERVKSMSPEDVTQIIEPNEVISDADALKAYMEKLKGNK
jgi:hypothetical protein